MTLWQKILGNRKPPSQTTTENLPVLDLETISRPPLLKRRTKNLKDGFGGMNGFQKRVQNCFTNASRREGTQNRTPLFCRVTEQKPRRASDGWGNVFSFLGI